MQERGWLVISMQLIKVSVNNHNKHRDYISLLLLIWVCNLLFLGILESLGFSFGFNVWPMGEDRNWLGFMMTAPGLKMTQAFWQMNDRNPLSAWWWLAISPFIRHWDFALYLVRKIIDPFLSITIFLLLNQLSRGKNHFFCFCVALTVLFWNFSSYYEQIIWEFLSALNLNLLSIYFYCKYVDTNRSRGDLLALALISYLVAIATYTLQSGAVIAIACIAFFRQQLSVESNLIERIRKTVVDVAFFGIIFVIYNCIWYTVSRNVDAFYILHWEIFFKQFFSSVSSFVYPPVLQSFWLLSIQDWSLSIVLAILLISFIVSFGIVYLLMKNATKVNDKNQMAWISCILLSISLPTIIVESTSSIWFPGTRSIMIQQIWQPLLYVSLIFFIIGLLPFFERTKSLISGSLVSALLAVVFLFNLNYNYHLVLRTHYQKNLKKGIKRIARGAGEKAYFLLRFTQPYDPDLNTIPIVIANYANTMLPHNNIFLRPIAHYPSPGFKPFWRIEIGEDSFGVKNAGPIGDSSPVPFKNLWIVYFDGKKVWVPTVLYKKDFAGLEVDWNRKLPLNQAKLHTKIN